MEKCVFCEADLEAETRICQHCGRRQPSGALSDPAPTGTNSSLNVRCPGCGGPAQPEDRFCGGCGQSFTQPCPACGTAVRIWAWSCPKCGQPGPRYPLIPGAHPTPRKRGPKIALVTLIVVVVVGIVSASFYYTLQRQSQSHPSSLATNAATPSSVGASTPIPQTSTPDLTSTSPANPPGLELNSPAATDISGLHIQTDGVICHPYLVLKEDRATYTNEEVQQMHDYLTNIWPGVAEAANTTRLYTPPQTPAPPDTLQWIPGGSQCGGIFHFTNTLQESVQIDRMGLKLTTSPQQNTYAYRLIDPCTILDPEACALGSTPPCAFSVNVQLAGGTVGTAVDAPVEGEQVFNSVCPVPLTLAPGQTVAVRLNVQSSQVDLLYRANVTLTLTTARGTNVIVLPPTFQSVLAFASDSQFSCYGLQGNTFVQEPLGPTSPCYVIP